MKTPATDIHDSDALGNFAAKEWGKALAFLQHAYGISEDDCKDIFQDAFMALLNNIKVGKLETMTSSLSTYFMAICKNKAQEFMRRTKFVHVVDDPADWATECEIRADKIDSLIALDDGDDAVNQKKKNLVRAIVKDLPSPCAELLWGVYRDNLSMRSLAALHHYSSEGVVKVTKHRCCEKFCAKYKELCKKIF